MNGNAARFFRLGGSFVGLVALGCVLTVQAAKSTRHGIVLPTDWTHSHLVFSQPGTVEQAMRLQQDPRFEQQLYRRGQPLRLPAAQIDRGGVGSPQLRFPFHPRRSNSTGLWDESLGAGATVGAVNFPAKFSFDSGVANCASATPPDFVVYSTGLTGSGASVIAYDNLYTGCTGTVPTVYWAYDTGGQILTSPVLSLDGTQLAFVQTAGGIGSLVLLKWAASATETVASPGVPTSVLPALYSACVAPCMTSLILQDTSHVPTDDITSSVFYDYTGDTIWVGDSRNWLHRFSPIFAAGSTPAEVGSPWPVQLFPTDATALASPVYDHGSGNVFVGDAGGFFYSVSASAGAVTQSSQLDHGTGIVAGPLVDSTAKVAYVFSSNDGSTNCAGGPCAAVYRFAAGFTAGTAGAEVTVGASAATPKSLYEGALDSAYESSNNAAGNMYVCGNTGGDPTLYQVQITSGAVLGTVVTGPVLTTASTACSPVTDILNPNAVLNSGGTGDPEEYIFAGVQASGTPTGCAAGGCLASFRATPWTVSHAYTVGEVIVDSNFHMQVVTTKGTSGSSEPTAWSTTFPGGTTTDGTVTWMNLGLTTATTQAGWVAHKTYAVGDYIYDSNTPPDIEVVTAITTGLSGSFEPVWPTTVGTVTPEAPPHVTWTNAGPAPGAIASAGGTSAVIVDNIVGSGTLAGASQVYFQTQGNQATCGTATNVGCAIQASQSALK
jgi:hypothetical protein